MAFAIANRSRGCFVCDCALRVSSCYSRVASVVEIVDGNKRRTWLAWFVHVCSVVI